MMRKLTILFTVVLTTMVFYLAAQGAAGSGPVSSKLTAQELARVKAGEIVVKNEMNEESSSGHGVAFGIFHGSKEDFWKVIFDYDNYLDIYPRLEKVTLIERDGNKYVVEFHLDATLKTIVYTTINILSEDRTRLRWTLDQTRPHKYLKVSDGYWQLEELEPGVLLGEYKVIVELDLGILTGVVSGIVRSMSRDDLPDVLIATRKRMESGGTWTRHQR